MKRSMLYVAALLSVLAALAGCSTMPQESAMEWMQRQPFNTDP